MDKLSLKQLADGLVASIREHVQHALSPVREHAAAAGSRAEAAHERCAELEQRLAQLEVRLAEAEAKSTLWRVA